MILSWLPLSALLERDDWPDDIGVPENPDCGCG